MVRNDPEIGIKWSGVKGGYMGLYLTAIITSLIAAVVFWLFFNVVPFWVFKYSRIRPKVVCDLKDISGTLLHFLEIPFVRSVHSASLYQNEIRSGTLTENDFENALYGKCLSPDRCVQGFEHRLLPVGNKLNKVAQQLDEKIDRIFRYSDYLRTREVVLLREIGKKIHTHEYEERNDIVDGVVIKTVNPSISYMKRNFYELYNLYQALKKKCDFSFYNKRNINERLSFAIEVLKDRHYWIYRLMRIRITGKKALLLDAKSAYMKGNKKRAEKKLRKYLELEEEKLVNLRGYFDYIQKDEVFIKILEEIRGKEEVNEWINCVAETEKIKIYMSQRNNENKAIIDEMKNNNPKITELDEKGLMMIRKLFDGYL